MVERAIKEQERAQSSLAAPGAAWREKPTVSAMNKSTPSVVQP